MSEPRKSVSEESRASFVVSREALRHLVDHVWNVAYEDQSVPATDWADRMIAHVFPADEIDRLTAAKSDGQGNSLSEFQRDAGLPHPPTELTLQYRRAMGGEGPHAGDWADKPHRLVYDLCRKIEEDAALTAAKSGVGITDEMVEAGARAVADAMTFTPWPDREWAMIWSDKARRHNYEAYATAALTAAIGKIP